MSVTTTATVVRNVRSTPPKHRWLTKCHRRQSRYTGHKQKVKHPGLENASNPVYILPYKRMKGEIHQESCIDIYFKRGRSIFYLSVRTNFDGHSVRRIYTEPRSLTNIIKQGS